MKSGDLNHIERIVGLLHNCGAFQDCPELQFIFVDSSNTDEIARIQRSLPNDIQAKVQVLSQHDFFKGTVESIAPSAPLIP